MPQPLATLDQAEFDVIVIGAGAVGCASARELAGRGFRILLIDRGDIGVGAASRVEPRMAPRKRHPRPDKRRPGHQLHGEEREIRSSGCPRHRR
ncbi:FAD-dependent oxidoreductase [Pseudogemmobacter sonorensis]|uniref:FAD-dependent oxidoreductase n=1 Tax=Pseudogemmobacter sonorensis TaxID=2989681 RepID=UPI0036BB2101